MKLNKYFRIILVFLPIALISSCTGINFSNTAKTADTNMSSSKFVSGIQGIIQSNLRSQYRQLPQSLDKASFYQVQIVIADDYRSMTGKQSIRYCNNEGSDLNDFYLQLYPNAFGPFLKIKQASINGIAIQPLLKWNDTAAKLDFPTPLKPGDEAFIQLDFELKVPGDFTFSYGLFVYADEILSLYQFIPIIPVFEQGNWRVYEPNTIGDLTYTDAAFFEVTVDAPQSLVMAASGTRVFQEVKNGRRLEIFQAGPVRDFYLAGSPNFQATTRKWQDVVITSYAPSDVQSSSDQVLSFAENALKIFSEEFGPYPYNELDVISAPMHNAYGMEYSGIVSISIDLYDPEGRDRSRTNLEFTTAHEIAHQWFFNMIGSDQVMEPWLDEGMAQFASRLYFLRTGGEQAAYQSEQSFHQRWMRIQSQPIPIGQPVAAYNERDYSAIIYGRAPLFILALQERLGRDAFEKFLDAYYQKFLWGNVSTVDFRAEAEKACQCNLASQFNQWVYGE